MTMLDTKLTRTKKKKKKIREMGTPMGFPEWVLYSSRTTKRNPHSHTHTQNDDEQEECEAYAFNRVTPSMVWVCVRVCVCHRLTWKDTFLSICNIFIMNVVVMNFCCWRWWWCCCFCCGTHFSPFARTHTNTVAAALHWIWERAKEDNSRGYK